MRGKCRQFKKKRLREDISTNPSESDLNKGDTYLTLLYTFKRVEIKRNNQYITL